MANAVWPTTGNFPQVPTKSGFRRGPTQNVQVFRPELGPAKRRRRHTAVGKVQSHTFVVTGVQATYFEETFFHDALADGSLPFDWAGPRDGAVYAWCFDEGDPYSLAPLPTEADMWQLDVRVERQP